MRKILILFSLFVLNVMVCHSQFYYVSSYSVSNDACRNIVNMIVVRNDTTTKVEGEYLNEFFSDVRSDFDFTGKKIAFFRGNSGTIQYSKWEYFLSRKNYLKTMDTPKLCGRCFVGLYIFTPQQKKESGGYDAAIVINSKINDSAQTVVRRLKRSSST